MPSPCSQKFSNLFDPVVRRCRSTAVKTNERQATQRAVTALVAVAGSVLVLIAGVLFAQGRPVKTKAIPPAVSTTTAVAGSATASQTTKAGNPATPATVDIADFAFAPNPIVIAAGSSVSWTNKDSFAHTVKFAGTPTLPADESPSLATGQTFTKSFATSGTYTYICGIHNSMVGTVTVT